VLVELGLLEQRHKAVLEVLNGATVTDVARRYGGGPTDPARLAATLRPQRHGRPIGPKLQASHLPAPRWFSQKELIACTQASR
jgi:hypothetical protein